MNHQELVEFRLAELLADRPNELYELTIELRRYVKGFASQSSEMLYKTYAVSNVFTFSDRLKEAFIHIAVYAEHVNLGFNYGATFDDPTEVLKGTGKLIRHIRVDSIAKVKKPPVKKLIRAAVAHGKEMANKHNGIHVQQLIDKTL